MYFRPFLSRVELSKGANCTLIVCRKPSNPLDIVPLNLNHLVQSRHDVAKCTAAKFCGTGVSPCKDVLWRVSTETP